MSSRDKSHRERSDGPLPAFCSSCGRPVKGGKGGTRCDHCSSKKAVVRSEAPGVSHKLMKDTIRKMLKRALRRQKRVKRSHRDHVHPSSSSASCSQSREEDSDTGSSDSESSSSVSSEGGSPPSEQGPPDIDDILQVSEEEVEDSLTVAALCARSDKLIKKTAKVLHLDEVRDEPECKKKKTVVAMAKPPKARQFFSGHDDFQSGMTASWKHPDKAPALPRFLDHKYPFSKKWLSEFATPHPVDSQLTSLNKGRLLPAADAAGLTDPVDRKIEQDVRLGYAYVTAACRPVLAASWCSLVVSHRLEYLLSVMAPSAPEEVNKWLIPELNLMKDFTEFLREAVMDAGKISGQAAAILASVRRSLWLRMWKGDAGSKRTMSALPLTSKALFGPQLARILKEASSASSKFPQPPAGQKPSGFRKKRGNKRKRDKTYTPSSFRGNQGGNQSRWRGKSATQTKPIKQQNQPKSA